MITTPQDDLFDRYESQYVRDLEGRLIRIEAATLTDLKKTMTVTIDGQRVEQVPKAVPATDDQGNILRDERGNVKPRLTTVYDAATWRYALPQTKPPMTGASSKDTLLPEARNLNPIPILCHQHHQRPIGVCRVCSVLTTRKGQPGSRLVPACQHPLVDGMEFHTVASTEMIQFPGTSEKVEAGAYVRKTVKVLVELLAVNHLHRDQPSDQRRYQNELLSQARQYGVQVASRYGRLEVLSPYKHRAYSEGPERVDDSSGVIRVDHNHCILCDRCVRGCSEVKPFKIIGHTGFGNKARISFDLGVPMAESGCVSCGECAVSCPTGALTFKSSIYQDRNPWEKETLRPQTVPAEQLEHHPLFKEVPYAFLKWNEGSVGRAKLEPGGMLCLQGEYGSTAFIIESGVLQVLVNSQIVARQTPKDFIVGELGCLSHLPRTASLRADDEGATVMVIKRNMLHMLQRNRAARDILGPIYRRRALNSYLQHGQLFAGLPREQSQRCIEFLAGRDDVEFIQVDPGQAIFLEGSPADSFYIIYRGHVSVSETATLGVPRVRDYLGAGRQFGEIGLLTDPGVSPTVAHEVPAAMRGRRTGTCTALDHVELVAIRRDAFRELLEAEPEIRERLEKTACEILARSRQMKNVVGAVMGDFTEAGLYQGQNLLVLDLNRCTRCQECVKACANSHGGTTRLILEGNRFGEYLVPSACRSCHDPMCLTGCPVDAIHRRPADPRRRGAHSLAIVIEDHCIGCGLCAHNCPYGSIHMAERPTGGRQAETRIATNCDLCEEKMGGNPQCVHHCPHDAAIRVTGEQLASMVGLKVAGPGRNDGKKPR